jgi:hypothetical protein
MGGLGFGLYWIELRRVVSIFVSGLLLTGDVVMIMVTSGGVSIVNVVEGARMRVRVRGKVKRVVRVRVTVRVRVRVQVRFGGREVVMG